MKTKNIKYLTLSFLMCINVSSYAQVPTYAVEKGQMFERFPMLEKTSTIVNVPNKKGKISKSIIEKLKIEDIANDTLNMPYRFGYKIDVDYTLDDGVWMTQNDKKVWKLRISSPDAYSINLVFSKLTLSTQTELYIYNKNETMIQGPITHRQNIPKGFNSFGTDIIDGDEVILLLIEPKETENPSILHICKVVHGYRETTLSTANVSKGSASKAPAAYNCHNDVSCYPAWENEANGVARILIDNTLLCSGTLINNTSINPKSFFLTAFHCLDSDSDNENLSNIEKNVAQNMQFLFKYKKAFCNGVLLAHISYQWADFRAAWSESDFALMELRDRILEPDITFSGWDKTGNKPNNGTTIHHPNGDFMRISFDNDSPTSNGLVSVGSKWYSTGYLWKSFLDNGTTEGGSSGAPFFDQNHRIVGQLLGGMSGCPNIRKYFGKFSKSWAGNGANDTRLSNWLDPNNTGKSTINSRNCLINLINTTISNNHTEYGCGATVQNLNINNNAKVLLDVDGETSINSINIGLGSEFEIK